ncbi:MAG: ATP-binding protein, partial [Gemmatimonadota bacterium]
RESALQLLLESERDGGSAPRAKLLVVSGPSGGGRTRLMEELAAREVVAGATVATMRAVEIDARDANAALLALSRSGLDAAPGSAAAPPGALGVLVARVPEWANRFPNVPAVDAMPLRDAFTAVLRATAEERPLLLAIDDADRLHAEELRWLPALLRDLAGLPVTLLLTATVASGSAAMDELTRSAGRDLPGAAVRLEALSLGAIRKLVDWTVPQWSDEARDRLARRVWAESAGLPGIAVEVLRAVEDGLTMEGAEWPAPDRTLDATLPGPLPEPLVAAIRIAFRRLPPEAANLLSAASLLEEPFSAARAGCVAEVPDKGQWEAGLDTLEWEGWLVMDGRGYSFPARARRRVIAHEMITPGRRRRLLDRIAACR